ncbi:uncharacterized protein B0T23DRAFT_410391 [Neurospora hispaniola]|uniref:Uncharacterized protein n=1 Tax=Neurospora hispaniola TaxID=588809 RepID=A0AAJ0IC89_9PEZI|nr:hypothetical protein B0T23DRAFT_410391 [Neurospora hispaniola]
MNNNPSAASDSCIDIFASMSGEYFEMVREGMVPLPISMLAPSVEIFYYIVSCDTQWFQLMIRVAPGKLDIDPAALWWLAGHANNTMYLCGAAGILKSKKACGPRGLQEDLRTRFEDQDVIRVAEKLRWVGDGNLWLHYRHFPGPVAKSGLKLVKVDERPQRHEDRDKL